MMPTASLRASRRAVASIFTLNGVVLASWVSHVPSVKTALRLSDGQLGTLLLAMALGAVSALSIVGWLNTRFGSRRMTLAMAVGLCLALPLPEVQVEAGTGTLLVAGLLVGMGTRYGSGCTSGHGVCGLSRLSMRSLVATAAFMLAGFVTVYIVRHLMG